jgi:hypothetical protein
VSELLRRAGFKVYGSRAECKFCSGSAHLTVRIFDDGGAFCHRCKRSWTPQQLRKGLGLNPKLTPEEKAAIAERERERQFRAWCWQKYDEVAKQYRCLARKAELAKQILSKYADEELAWEALARFYHAEFTLARQLDAYSLMKAGRVSNTTARQILISRWEKETSGSRAA